jgi:hypothetical protein
MEFLASLRRQTHYSNIFIVIIGIPINCFHQLSEIKPLCLMGFSVPDIPQNGRPFVLPYFLREFELELWTRRNMTRLCL